ncbi:putative transcriptional regulatory protein C16G5.16 [Choanephora cucurbitarum]|uniref:Putative transcriptional regulatory protein C16G5.16 n=1 Tax=Choanephora cucurbitarum TaxID=101091 RepID=A0A1C7NPT1_9FUNG|nr:putative transcriptional regulatory protein C16G5.16 [Choanephora cucurbitarum]
MPFDTLGRSLKRIRPTLDDVEEDAYYVDSNIDWSSNYWNTSKQNPLDIELREDECTMASSPATASDILESTTHDHLQPSLYSLSMPSPGTSNSTNFWNQTPISIPNSSELDIWSKFNLSYTDVGINMEANVTSASELHSLIDAFSKLCNTNLPVVAHDSGLPSPLGLSPSSLSAGDYLSNKSDIGSSGIKMCRNKSHKLKPINYFASVGKLGQSPRPAHSKHGQISLRQVADACVETYFTCWIRNTPILKRDEFMTWYHAQPDPANTLIVNAICVSVFRHMVVHHSRPGLEHFVGDEDKIQEQEEYFFEQAREYLSQSFDHPDRFTIIALQFILFRAEPSKRHHYAGMAVSALHELEIYPRTVDEADDESYEKEMDTRLWWSIWAFDFYVYSAGGAVKNTPQPRIPGIEIDLPRVMEQDIDEDEIAIIAYIHCLRLWRIQAHFLSVVYEQESDMTLEQLLLYDQQLLDFYANLPNYLKFDSGFEYGHEDLFLACIRVNIEYNATRIILHKLFVPDVNDTRPSQSSLESLNICLKMALKQLPALNSGAFLPNGRCAFDRDELWRAAEMISMAMDVYRSCASIQDRALILKDIRASEFENGLAKALDILKNTMEYEAQSRNWIQVADWLEVEIRRHERYSNSRNKPNEQTSTNNSKLDYFLANLKTDAEKKRQAGMIDTDKIKHDLHRRMSNSSSCSSIAPLSSPTTTSHQGNILSPVSGSSNYTFSITKSSNWNSLPAGNEKGAIPIPFKSKSPSNPIQFNSPPTHTSFVQYNPKSPSDSFQYHSKSSNQSKNQAKFRYFSPKKMNKYMFIDDNPML